MYSLVTTSLPKMSSVFQFMLFQRVWDFEKVKITALLTEVSKMHTGQLKSGRPNFKSLPQRSERFQKFAILSILRSEGLNTPTFLKLLQLSLERSQFILIHPVKKKKKRHWKTLMLNSKIIYIQELPGLLWECHKRPLVNRENGSLPAGLKCTSS